MKKILLPVLLVVVALTMISCSTCSDSGFKFSYTSSDEMEVSTRDIRGFEKIEVIGSPTVFYTQADSFSVRVKGPKDLVPNIITEVNGNTLSIRNKGKIGIVNVDFGRKKGLSVYVTSPDLTGVVLSGSGDFISERTVDTDVLNIQLKGSGDIKFADVVCDRCDAELVGSGDLDIEHLDTRETSATLIGSGDLDIRQMNAANTQLQLRGSGDIDVEFISGCGSVTAELQGSGDISLKGRVKHFEMRKRGSGDINSSDLKVGQ
jgi:hypothetical protein